MEGGKSSSSFLEKALLINPYYFAFLLLGMLSFNLFHLMALQTEWTLSPVYFLTYAFLESLLEVLLLVFFGNVIKTYLPKSFYYGYVTLAFLWVVLHYADFILTRFMDISVFYGIDWVFRESLDNFIELLHITGISLHMWCLIFGGTLLLLPLIAMILYKTTGKLVRAPLKVTHRSLLKTLFCLPLGLAALDLTVTPKMTRHEYHYYQKILPWKSTMISQEAQIIHMKHPLKTLPDESAALKKIHSASLALEKKPNIYLFVVESLREDFITPDVAKNIASFREENLSFKKTYSNSNCTQKGWYSIFHANYPFHWVEAKKSCPSGSIPLQILKKSGYDIHIYSAAQLNYYGMANVMFGKRHYLADSYHVYPHYFPVEAWESDEKAVNRFLVDLDKQWVSEGNVFIFFIESTHFNYSWPKKYPTHFQPVSLEKTHLRYSNSLKNIQQIKNRYRNSIHYVDSLFGKVIETLKKKGLYDEALILFSGDHGEEFFEEGQLFHASHLSPMQTEPPIYMKLGDPQQHQTLNTQEMRLSQVDLFPSVIDYLLGPDLLELFDGESIFKEKRSPYVISGRFNGPQAPEEFFIHDGNCKCFFRLVDTQTIEIKEVKDSSSHILEGVDPKLLKTRFKPAFKKLFNRH